MPRNDKSKTTTSSLLLAISNASTTRRRRRQQSRSLQQETQSLPSQAYHEREDILKCVQLRKIVGQRGEVVDDDDDDDDGDEEDVQAKTKIAQLHKRKLEEWHINRYKSSLKNQLSRAQVDDAVLRLADHLLFPSLHETQTHHPSSKPPPSSSSSSSAKDEDEDEDNALSTLSQKIVSLWNANQTRIRSALPRYFEGYPVRERIQPPLFLPRRSQKPSGLGDCLQCLAKGLPCSMSVLARGRWGGSLGGGCRRCVAEGERCIIEHDVVEEEEEDVDDEEEGRTGREESGLWDWWDGVPDRDQDVDSAAEAIEMWERRRKGMKLELMGGRMLWVESRGFAPRGVMKDE
ncbi:hypothetical protein CCMA1212_006027 [Trichoderma ghanense]|uniref:Uncharacterized protein n=1 Tax=Trichoderma ghanense TaxID=65468 RepID=A0ABY2H118_9HYPO